MKQTADRSPFRVMCQMWGIETAIKKSKEFGITVSDDEIKAEREKDEQFYKSVSETLKAIKEN